MNNLIKYFDPETLARIRPLGIRARTLVEGLVAGQHRSPLRGQSLEFSQHREYVPGDDLRQVDWKVFGRSDKYYVRQYEDETNLTAMILVDQSQSMDYRSNPKGLSKLEYAQLIACSLAYLITAQQDSVGLATFSDRLHEWLRPSGSPAQLDDAVRLLELPRKGSTSSQIAVVLHETATRLTKPNLIVLVSDLMDDQRAILQSMKGLHFAGHDLMVLHVLDRYELSFPFDQACEFDGLESQGSLVADPLMIAGAYRKAMQEQCQAMELGCMQLQSDYFRLVTDESLAVSLPNLLSQRLARKGWA